ncbi:MAG: hypothetical protein ACM3ST_17175 [Bdellovibrio bacteriovorus]
MPRRHQIGLAMVELLVAMAVGLFLMGGILQVFVSSKASYRVGEANSRVQENGRFAVQMLASDLRGARGTGCRSMALDEAQDSLNVVACGLLWSDGPVDCEGVSAIGADTPLGYTSAQRGTSDWLAGLPGSPASGAQLKVARQWLRGDVLVAWGTLGEGVYARTSADPQSADLTLPIDLVSPHRDLEGGRLALITDCEATDIFTITNPKTCQTVELDAPTSLEHQESYDADGNPENCGEAASADHSDSLGGQVNATSALARAYNRRGTETSPGTTLRARVFPFEYSVFYVCCMDSRYGTIQEGGAVNNCNTNPSRYRPAMCRWSASAGAQQTVSDVADMRVTYDGFVDQVGGARLLDLAGAVTDAAWVSAQGHWGRVDSARIQILATTAEEVRIEVAVPNPSASTAADLGYGLAADRRIYHAFDVTAAIRSSSPWFLPP